MKATFLFFTCHLLAALLPGSTGLRAQDFQALPPAERPNAAELTYFISQHSLVSSDQLPDSAALQLVVGFLTDLTDGQFETARGRLADDFQAFGPGFDDFLSAADLLAQWDRHQQLFSNQQLTVEAARLLTATGADREGQWVFVKAVWMAADNRRAGKPIRIPFYELAQVRANRIQRTYVSYGNDQIFYDLGLPIYASQPSARSRKQ